MSYPIRNENKSLRSSKRQFLLTWLIPTLTGFFIFRIWPLLYGLYISFFNWDIFSTVQEFVGFDNYIKELNHPIFTIILKNTIVYAISVTILGLIIAMVIALLLNSIRKFQSFFRAIYFLPYVTSMIAVSIIWMWLYQPQFGLFNAILKSSGFKPLGWLKSVSLAMPSIIIMSVWRGVGFTFIILLAGLKNIPKQLYEAASIDGANGWQQFKHITIPLLRPVILFVTVTGVMEGFHVFQQIYVMTDGGPLDSTRVLAYRIFQLGFENLFFGRAAALAYILFVIVLIITLIQFKIGETKWNY